MPPMRIAPEARIVILSMHDEGPFPPCLMELGVCGYLTKSCVPGELVRAIRQVHCGRRYVSAEVAQKMVLSAGQGGDAKVLETLSPRELEVMVMVSKGRKPVEMADKLSVSPKTVSTYRARVMKKLGIRSDVELTHLALRHGLIEPGATV